MTIAFAASRTAELAHGGPRLGADSSSTRSSSSAWVAICPLAALHPERGVAAIVAGQQLALFRLTGDELVAVQQSDPYSGAQVMSRGLVGTRGGRPTVASPMFKQVFDLRSGECLDAVGKEHRDLETYPVRVEEGTVLVAVKAAPGGAR